MFESILITRNVLAHKPIMQVYRIMKLELIGKIEKVDATSSQCTLFSCFRQPKICFFTGKISEREFLSKGYRPEARGYVIYFPRALTEGAALGQHTRGMNHITTS